MAAKIFMDLPGEMKMPAIGLGTFQVTDDAELEQALEAALEIGYRHIDTAFLYCNEKIIGRVLKKWISSGKLKREDLFITSKLPPCGVHPDRVELFLKKSLEDLQMDYIDLYLIHFPVGLKYVNDQLCPPLNENGEMDTEYEDLIEVWKKMEEQVDVGRAKAIGLSNFTVDQISRVLKSARIIPANLQIEIHVYFQQHELVDFCHKNGISVTAYCPLGAPGYNQFNLAMGRDPKPLPDMLNDEVIKSIATKHKKSNAQVMLRYLLQRNIVAIPKSVKANRLEENINVFDFTLDDEDMKTLNSLNVGESVRIADFKAFNGIENHPEYPFKK